MEWKGILESEAKAVEAEVRDLRHQVHMYPETGYEEVKTAALIAKTLDEADISYRAGVAVTGTVATIEGRRSGPVVALRADMDALRKEEAIDEADRPWRSKHSGIMHACGHDGHVAVLLGAAKILKKLSDRFDGTVKCLFQPAEEGGAGGRRMVKEGVLEDPDVDAIFALHGWPLLGCGAVGLKPGTSMASASRFIIEVEGLAGHAAYPHNCIDPVPAAAQIISALQTVRSREINPNLGSVISVTIIETGSRLGPASDLCDGELAPSQSNIIPSVVRLKGTSRALTPDGQDIQLRRIREIAESIGAAFRTPVNFWGEDGYPPTINDKAMTDLAARTAQDLLGEDQVHWLEEPSMGGEDFSYYLQKIPGCIFRLGTARGSSPEALAAEPALHSDAFDFNDDAILPGLMMLCGTALRFLQGG